jgi:predicted dehydrogenase/acetyltransferase-like isoleucine patch superfamily enzyme
MAARESPMTRVAVVGCGYWGKNLVRNFHQLGALAAISDSSPEVGTKMQERFNIPALDFDAILSSDVAAVVISAPAKEHGGLVRRALNADKHVFVEKPLALELAEAEAVCALAQERKRVLMVGHLLQYHPGFLKLKELSDCGALGRLLYVYSTRVNLGKVRREENILWSFAPHDISMILALTGELPEEVSATGSCYLQRSVADVTTTHLRFASGINAHVFVSWLHPFKEQKLIVVGERAMAVFDDGQDWDAKLQLFPHTVEWRQQIPVASKAAAAPIPLAPCEPLTEECRHFLDAIARGTPPRTDGREGLGVLRVLDAAEKSMRSGRPERLGSNQSSPQVRNVPYIAHETAVIDAGCDIGQNTRIWHFSHILGGSVIGRDCIIGQNVMIGPQVRIGNGCKIQNNVSIYKGVELHDAVFCGPSCVFTNVRTPRAEIERKSEFLPTVVERGVTIGANATIVCGSRLGTYSFIAAGAVVRGDVLPFSLMAGVPARRIGWVSHAGERLGDDLTCPRTGRRYQLTDQDRLQEISHA